MKERGGRDGKKGGRGRREEGRSRVMIGGDMKQTAHNY